MKKILLLICSLFAFSLSQESVEYVDANISVTEKKTDTKALSEKPFSLGLRLGFAYGMMTGNELNPNVVDQFGIDPFSGWAGINGNVGFAFNYFFMPKLAVVTGLDVDLLGFVRMGKGEKIVYVAVRNNLSKKGTYRATVNSQSLLFYGLSLPVSLRYYVMDFIWAELGLRTDFWLKGAVSYNLVDESAVVYGNAFDPFKVESSVVPNVVASFGATLPVSGMNIDAGLTISYGLSALDIDYKEQTNVFEIGFNMNFWLY